MSARVAVVGDGRSRRRPDEDEDGLFLVEMAVAFTIVVILWALQAYVILPVIDQSRAAMALGTHAGTRTELIVHFALHGRFPDDDRGGVTTWASEPPRVFDHGAVTYRIRSAAEGGPLTVLTIRPWSHAGDPPATLGWLCGYARPPIRPAVVFGANRTTVEPRKLPRFCREEGR